MDIKTLDEKINKLLHLREQKRTLDEKRKDLQAKYDTLKNEVIADLEGDGVDSFRGSIGSVSLVRKESVKMPTNAKARQALFNYLRSQDIYDEMITIHSAKLNSWFRAERELKIEEGDLNWQAPGIDDIRIWTDISLRS